MTLNTKAITTELDLAWEAHTDDRRASAFEHLHNAVREIVGAGRPQPDNEDAQDILRETKSTSYE